MEANGRIGQFEAVEAKLSRLKNYHKVLNVIKLSWKLFPTGGSSGPICQAQETKDCLSTFPL